MNLPTHFYLKRKKWVVELVDKPEWHTEEKCWGITDFESRTIEIWDGLPPRQILMVFIHEYLHAVEYEYKLAIAHRLIYKLEKPLTYMVFLLLRVN